MTGNTVADAVAENEELAHFVRWPSFVEGPECHIIPAREWRNKLDPPSDLELERIEELVGDYLAEGSRLGSFIKVKPELNNLTIALRELMPFQTI